MDSFFTVFKKKFVNHCKEGDETDLGGRYFAFVLQEVILECPELLKALFKASSIPLPQKIDLKNVQKEDIQIEFSYKDKDNDRRADLCIKKEGVSITLIEIKWEDTAIENQIEDYLAYCKHNKLIFIYLVKNQAPKCEIDLIKKHNQGYCSYADLYKELNKINKDNAVLRLFIKFLEDHIMIYKNEIPIKPLLYVMKQSLGWQNRDGLSKMLSSSLYSEIPELWNILASNMKVISDRFISDFSERGIYKQKPKFGFEARPYYNIEKTRKILNKFEDNNENEITFNGKNNFDSGCFYLFNYISLNIESGYLGLSFGIKFYIELENKKLKIHSYALIEGNKANYSKETKIYTFNITEAEDNITIKEDKFYSGILKNIKDVTKLALEEQKLDVLNEILDCNVIKNI